jgi:hypothetical protein
VIVCSSPLALVGPNVLYQKKRLEKSFFISCVFVLNVKVSCDVKIINLRSIKHFELALLFLSDAVKLEKVVCEWVYMLWVGCFR